MNRKPVCFFLVTSLGLLFLLVSPQKVCAQTSNGITYSSGVHLYSPLNITYTTNMLTLNLTFKEGIKSHLNYTLDGQYSGDIPLSVKNDGEFHFMWAEMVGNVPLHPLSDGSHCLTITVHAELNDFHGANPPGAPFIATNAEGTNFAAVWVHTVYFIVDTSNAKPTLHPTTSIVQSSRPTDDSQAISPTETIQSPVMEQQQSLPIAAIIILVALVAAYTAIIIFLVAKKYRP